MNDRSASGRKDWFCVALDSIPAAVIPSLPRAKAGAAGTLNAADNSVDGTSHSSSASASARGSGGSAKGSARESTDTKSNSASKSATGSASGKNAAAAPASGGSANGNSGAASQPQNGAESNFLQALAQSQAAAANDASASATPPASADVADAKAKAAGETDSAAVAAALSLASQSLAAAMAGQRPATPPPTAPATSRQDDSASAVSLARGTSIPDLLSMITKDVADGAKSPPDAAILTAASPAPAQDSNSTSATAIQAAQMSVGSHFGIQHTAANPDVTTGDLRAPVGTAAFNDELGGRLTWMAHQGVESGSLQLSPEHLGPLEVRIQVQDGAASVWFGANHADTRAALEQALPHLRQMFASQGLTLSDAGVSREPPRGQAQKPAVAAISSINGVSDEQSSLVSVSGGRAGLLDTYA
jgi:flagellar hook-length control protein FliK